MDAASLNENQLKPLAKREVTFSRSESSVDPSVPADLGVGIRVPTLQKAIVDPLSPTLFHEHWWLSVASGGRFSEVEVTSDGKPVGRLPFLLRRQKVLMHLVMPTLTHFLGPAIVEGEGSANTKFLRRLKITRELIRKLPSASSYEIKCHAGVNDVIAFQAENFRTSVQFTHEVHPSEEPVLWSRLRDKTRNVIRRAQEQYSVTLLEQPLTFIDFYKRNLRENLQEKSHLDLDVCEEIIRSCLARGRGRILTTMNAQGEMVAANFCAWDARSAYYLMATRTKYAGNGAASLLVWRAMADAARNRQIFDMDGLASEGGILFLAGFGAEVRPRYIAERATLIGRLRQGYRTLRGLRRSLHPSAK